MHALRIKICGVTTPADVELCATAGADAVGVNFHPGSKRYVDPRASRPLLRSIPPLMAGVGVFVGLPLRQVTALAYQVGLRGVQTHGEPRETGDPFPFSLVAAFRVRDRQSLSDIDSYLAACRAAGHLPAAVLADAYVEGQEGGTGQTAPWDLLAGYRPGVPLILAGGLTPENVGEAIRVVRPAGVDVASGVESAPGKKDPDKVRRFVAAVRGAAAGL
ncbi:MAG TPA: phosphoribosylanthranilate isomerase [Gemmataceae bacterium]|nr:phosphoribosylanthranilate isomerase [Gemmataceae bacterium]